MTSLLGVNTSSFGLRRPSNSDTPSSPYAPASPVSSSRSTFPSSGNNNAIGGSSLLFPVNPAFTDSSPAGGILLNKRRPSDTPEYVADSNQAQAQAQVQAYSPKLEGSSIPVDGLPAGHGYSGSPSPVAFKVTNLPMSPALSSDGKTMTYETGCQRSSSPESVSAGLPSAVNATTGTPTRPTHGRMPSSTKIRFAPLPTPNRKRSLSTGRNIVTKAKLEPDGTRTLQRFSKQDGNDPWVSDDDRAGPRNGEGDNGISSSAVDDDDEDEEGDDDEDERKKPSSSLTSSSWMTMGMGKKRTGSITSSSYTYTKKLLKPFSGSDSNAANSSSADTGDSTLTFGMPLRKTISTGGLMGSSPFRSSHEQERRRSFLSTGSSKDKENKRHLRNGSTSETPDFSSLSSSLGYKAQTDFAPSAADMPKSDRRPVKMLNGRVYGAKKGQAGSAGSLKAQDPEFSEWGGLMGAKGGGLGSNAPSATTATRPNAPPERRSGFLDDEDDGSGMGWVKRRREQKERERRASELATPDKGLSEGDVVVGSVPALKVTPPHWPESFSPGGESERSVGGGAPEFISTRPSEATIMEESSVPGTPHEEGTGGVAIKVPRGVAGGSGLGPALGGGGERGSAVEDDSGSEDSEGEEDDDNDFESDDEDEVELDMEGLGANSRSVMTILKVAGMQR
jgi:hypothetical protein